MRPWQYVTGGFAVFFSAILLAMNIMSSSQGADDGLLRDLMLGGSIAIDVGLVGFAFAMVHYHAVGRPIFAAMAFMLWGACGGISCYFSTTWLEGEIRALYQPMETTQAIATQKRQEATLGLDHEKEQLRIAEDAILGAPTQMKRDNAKTTADSIRVRIKALESERWPTEVVKLPRVRHGIVGHEWAVPLLSFLFAQIAWFITFGGFNHGNPKRFAQSRSGRPPLGHWFDGRPNKPNRINHPNQASPRAGDNIVPIRPSADQIIQEVMTMVRSGCNERSIAIRLDLSRYRVRQIKEVFGRGENRI